MNAIDFIIIYFAVGLPFGVHFYLKHRFKKHSILKSFITTLIWIPYSFKLFQSRITDKLINCEFDDKLALVSEKQKILEHILLKNNSDIPLFEFREIIERYIALSLNSKEDENSFGENKRELFRISKTPNVELSAICLNRLNRLKLKNHQLNARKDLVNLIEKLSAGNIEKTRITENFRAIATELEDYNLVEILLNVSSTKTLNNKTKQPNLNLKISTT